MYHKHWRLLDIPFGSEIDPRRFLASPPHEEALARLQFLAVHRRGVGVVLGEAGSGKSMLLAVFAEAMRRAGQSAALVNLVGVGTDEFLRQVNAGLGANPGRNDLRPHLWRMLADRIAESRYQELAVVILIDDADAAQGDLVTTLQRLAKLDAGPGRCMTVVLAGRYDRIGNVGSDLLELADLRIDLVPWDISDTQRYVQESVTRAGADPAIFTGSAILRIHQRAGGLPRRIGQLAHSALLAGAGRGVDRIEPDLVDSACEELITIELTAH
jgi:general secretion pathway protein A